MDITKKYFSLNHSFEKKLVFRLGSEAGFFSEFNNMVLAILYCLKHNIQFELYSKDANFGYKEGWKDYFLPFCVENKIFLNQKYNLRQDIYELSKKFTIKKDIFKKISGIDYLTFELWHEFHNKSFEKEYFNIPKLNLQGSTVQVAKQIIEMLWRFNPETEKETIFLEQSLNLPESFIGLHIRGGDKVIEAKAETIEDYVNLAQEYN